MYIPSFFKEKNSYPPSELAELISLATATAAAVPVEEKKINVDANRARNIAL